MIKIKAEYGNTIIAFGDNGVSLKKRTEAELVNLGIIAHESQDPTLLKLFESLPSIDQLRRMKLEANIQKYQTKIQTVQPVTKIKTTKPKKVEIKKK